MKKILYVLILSLAIILPNAISAKTVKDIACDYKVLNPSGEYMTDVEIMITNYNNGEGDGKLSIFFKDKSGKLVSYSGPNYDWLNYETTEAYPSVMLRIFTTDKKGKDFANNYKANNRCPSIVSNLSTDGSSIDVEGHVLDSIYGDTTAKYLSPTKEYIRSDTGDWVSREEFYKDDDGKTTVKDDLVCEYSMKFDMYKITAPVVFTTMYNPTTGAKTYKARLHQSEYNISNLSDGITFSLGQGGSNIVKIEGDHLQKIFANDTCLPRTEIYHYYDMQEFYVITTDEQEASDNGAGGRYGDGDDQSDNSSENEYISSDASIQLKVGCDVLSSDLKNFLIQVLDLIKIAALILTIILGMFDFFKGVTSNEGDAMKKVWKSFSRRLIAVVILFLLPLILEFILGLITINGIDASNPLCGIK